ncbi:MAG: hypothetical protein ACKOZW_15000, partial [Cyanobium sp.]
IRERWRDDPTSLGLSPGSRSLRLLGDRQDLEDLALPAAAVQRLAQRGEQELWRVPVGVLQP